MGRDGGVSGVRSERGACHVYEEDVEVMVYNICVCARACVYMQVTLVLPKEQSRWYGKGAAGDAV